MYGVNGQWSAYLKIGGVEYAINPVSVPKLDWFENVHQNLPSLNLTLADKTNKFASIATAGDGVPIELTLGDGANNESSATFNIQGQPNIVQGNGYNYIHINAVLDKVSYLRSMITGLHEGTSASVLSAIASQHGLQADVDSTSDSQVWLPNNKTIASFVRSVADHGWTGEGGCLIPAVTSAGVFLYKNIMQAADSNKVFGQGYLPIMDWSAQSKAHVANHVRGYGSTTVGFDVTGAVSELGKITFSLFSNFLSASKVNMDSIGNLGAKIDAAVRPSGNTHENYQKALHQNRRIRSLFSSDINILVGMATEFDLLKKATVIPTDQLTSSPNTTVSGKYLLTARTRSLVRNKYVEKLVLTGQSLSE